MWKQLELMLLAHRAACVTNFFTPPTIVLLSLFLSGTALTCWCVTKAITKKKIIFILLVNELRNCKTIFFVVTPSISQCKAFRLVINYIFAILSNRKKFMYMQYSACLWKKLLCVVTGDASCKLIFMLFF